MRVKVYLVLRDVEGGGVEVIATRLTQGVADRIANQTPGAYTLRFIATKELELVQDTEARRDARSA